MIIRQVIHEGIFTVTAEGDPEQLELLFKYNSGASTRLIRLYGMEGIYSIKEQIKANFPFPPKSLEVNIVKVDWHRWHSELPPWEGHWKLYYVVLLKLGGFPLHRYAVSRKLPQRKLTKFANLRDESRLII